MSVPYPKVSPREWCLQHILSQAAFGFDGGFFEKGDRTVVVGDLVYLQSAPTNLEYVAWVEEIGEDSPGWRNYVLRGVGQDRLARWSNVGVIPINRKWVASMPRLKWRQDQWDWYAKWQRCVRRVDSYLYLPMLPEFDGDDVTIGFRTRHGITDTITKQRLNGWRKAKVSELVALLKLGLKAQEAASNNHSAKMRAERKAKALTPPST